MKTTEQIKQEIVNYLTKTSQHTFVKPKATFKWGDSKTPGYYEYDYNEFTYFKVIKNGDEFKIGDSKALKNFNFKLLDSVPVFLPGVNSLTKEVDGSVRIYSTWEISTEKTDSTEAKSGRLKMYESYDFDADGKILYQQGYGDFTGLMNYLTSK